MALQDLDKKTAIYAGNHTRREPAGMPLNQLFINVKGMNGQHHSPLYRLIFKFLRLAVSILPGALEGVALFLRK